MSNIKITLAAKTDVGVVRSNNEDNFQVIPDISSGQMSWCNNNVYTLGNLGTLLVVADGMGGMNAGEVASDIAIQTVKEYFVPQNITPEVTKNRYSIEKFMNSVIVAADKKIKEEARLHPETSGMGTTIVIAWIYDAYLYVSWCGDSRAYVYNSNNGLCQISKDHSYVQSLVDKGELSKEDAFDFPESNIIIRSLSDLSDIAKPESLLTPYRLKNDDIVLLCTDGLNGMIRDKEIERVIENNSINMSQCADELIKAACDAAGSDNITLCLCKILEGVATDDTVEEQNQSIIETLQQPDIALSAKEADAVPCKKECNIYKTLFYISLIFNVAILGFIIYFWLFNIKTYSSPSEENVSIVRSVPVIVDNKSSVSVNDSIINDTIINDSTLNNEASQSVVERIGEIDLSGLNSVETSDRDLESKGKNLVK